MSSLPESQRIYAIGDIHGRDDLLARLLDLIEADAISAGAAEKRLVFLGDYVDRGPDSHGVVQRLLTGLPSGMSADFLMGNHERLMLDAWADEAGYPLWLANGGMSTQKSYMAATLAAQDDEERRRTEGLVPQRHWMFFETLKLFVTHGEYLFVHAGVRPGVAIADQAAQDLLWIREPFLSYSGTLSPKVVHGHTPVKVPEFLPHRIGIDTGAVFTGRLTALVLEGSEHRLLTATSND